MSKSRWLAAALALFALAGCKDLLGTDPLPSGTLDPDTFKTPGGADQVYRKALSLFQGNFITYMQVSGVLTDEFRSSNYGGGAQSNAASITVDQRQLPSSPVNAVATDRYRSLQELRGYVAEAKGALAKYAPDAPRSQRGEMYAVEGYTEIMLADLFCSGVPLSTLDFEEDFTYGPSLTTAQLYEHAVAQFDTALVLAADSARILNFARVGRARALLALGRYQDAVSAVADVPQGYAYTFLEKWNGSPSSPANQFDQATIADGEGLSGLSYTSSHDPRSMGVSNGTNTFHQALLFPKKYGSPTATSAVTVADWIEAELIRAEADLKAGGANWLTMLNALRTTGVYTDVDTVVVRIDSVSHPPARDTTFRYDTAWVAGTAGVGYLGPLQDPGTADGRVDLLFRERAFWLFATGHRQGDLRRLIRQYDRLQESVYPTGLFLGGTGTYGSDVTFPIPDGELLNPHFTGCLDRDA
jgi:hypothetical protein